MTAAASAIEAAAYAALNVPALTGLATVYQHVPQNTPPPVVIVGDLDLEAFETKGADGDRQGMLAIVAVVEGEARKPLLDIQEKVEQLLDGHTAAQSGFAIQFKFETSDGILVAEPVSDQSDGGETYVGTSRFRVWALGN